MDQVDEKIIRVVAKKEGLKEPLGAIRFSSGSINKVYDLGNGYVLKIEGDPPFRTGHEILKPAVGVTARLLEKGARVPRILDYDTVQGNGT